MTAESPLTAAWNRIREQLTATADTLRENETAVVEAVADHGTIYSVTDDAVELVFTVPGETVDTLRDRVDGSSVSETEVQYTDTAGHRLYLLIVHTNSGPGVLIAGGVGHDRLRDHTDTTGSLRTRLRGVDDRTGLQLEHDELDPFVEDI